jgi:hypothetical protein
VVPIWNMLPEKVVTASSVSIFKHAVDEVLPSLLVPSK